MFAWPLSAFVMNSTPLVMVALGEECEVDDMLTQRHGGKLYSRQLDPIRIFILIPLNGNPEIDR